MRLFELALAILAALVIQTVLGRYALWLNGYVDLFTVVAATYGLLGGRVPGLVAGSVAGLIQDAFSGGLLGFNGIAKSTIGYLAGVAGHHLIVRGWWARLLFFAVASAADMAILAGVGHLAEQPRVLGEGLTPIYLCVSNAVAGILMMKAMDRKAGRAEMAR